MPHRDIAGFAEIAAPFSGKKDGKTKVVKSKSTLSVVWDKRCYDAFSELKERLATAPVFGYPDMTLPFILEIDASFNGLGAVLSQQQDGKLVVLGYLEVVRQTCRTTAA